MRFVICAGKCRRRIQEILICVPTGGNRRQHPWVDRPRIRHKLHGMKGEFTAIVESAPEGGFWAICPEIPGANGQGETIEEAKLSLQAAVQLIFEDRLADARRGVAQNVIKSIITIG